MKCYAILIEFQVHRSPPVQLFLWIVIAPIFVDDMWKSILMKYFKHNKNESTEWHCWSNCFNFLGILEHVENIKSEF